MTAKAKKAIKVDSNASKIYAKLIKLNKQLQGKRSLQSGLLVKGN